MKKLLPLFLVAVLTLSVSCSSLNKISGYVLNENDAASAVRELLQIGTRSSSGLTGADGPFSKMAIMNSIFPPEMQKVVRTLQQLGLSSEVDRFVNTMGTAAEQTSQKSIPIFLSGIQNMRLIDAMYIIKHGGISATDYLRTNIGDSLRRAVAPVMQTSLNEYKLAQQWNDLVKPVRVLLGDKVNLDLGNLMAGIVTNAMFNKIAEKEVEIRTKSEARTSNLLQRVFSKDWTK